MKTSPLKHRWLWIASVTLLILYGINYVFTPDIIGITRLEAFFRPKRNQPFDSLKWKQTRPGGGERYEMVDDLLRKQLLSGRSQEEVKAVLGEPGISAPVDDESAMYYMLGSQKDYPARSLLFPGQLQNSENWTLAIRFRDGHAYATIVKVD